MKNEFYFDYLGKNQKDVTEEITNEIYGITEKLSREFTEDDYLYLAKLVHDLKAVQTYFSDTESRKNKRLQHKRFLDKIQQEYPLDIESFDLSYGYKKDGYSCIACSDRNKDQIFNFAIWVNYKDRKIIFYDSNITKEILQLLNEYYSNKGYEVKITDLKKWEA